MDDLISRQAATQTALEFIVEYLGGAFDENLQKKLIERINALPSVQPDLSSYSDKLWRSAYERGKAEAQAEIIRCRDCKHNPKLEWFGCPMSHLNEKQRPETAWCWKGERRTDERQT